MRFLKTATAFLLRIVLFLPICFLAHACYALQAALECAGDGLMDMARGMRQITMAPYVHDIEKSIAESSTRDREALLRELQ